MGKTGPGWKGTDSVIILFKNTLPSLLRAIQTKARAPTWPPTPATPAPPCPRPSSVPGSDASFASRTAACSPGRQRRSLCPFVVSHRLQAPTQNLHFSFKSKKCHFAGPRTPARSRPSLFSVAHTSPPCFQPSSCPGLRLGPRSLPSPRDFGRAPPTCASPAPGARRSAPVRALPPC